MRLGLVCSEFPTGLEAYFYSIAHETVAPLTYKELRPGVSSSKRLLMGINVL